MGQIVGQPPTLGTALQL